MKYVSFDHSFLRNRVSLAISFINIVIECALFLFTGNVCDASIE